MRKVTALLKRKLAKVRVVVFDVDGVLTDGGVYYGPQGEALKRFSTYDGVGIERLLAAGLKVAFISGSDSPIIYRRAEKLKVTDVMIGANDKLQSLRGFCERQGVALNEVAYLGDDLNDVPCLKKVLLAVTVPNAVKEAKAAAHLILAKSGGNGAARELADLILSAR